MLLEISVVIASIFGMTLGLHFAEGMENSRKIIYVLSGAILLPLLQLISYFCTMLLKNRQERHLKQSIKLMPKSQLLSEKKRNETKLIYFPKKYSLNDAKKRDYIIERLEELS